MSSPHSEPDEKESLRQENLRLKRAVDELSVLNELAREIGASINTRDIMQKVIHRSLRSVHAEQGVITLIPLDRQNIMQTLVRSMASTKKAQPIHIDQALLGWMQLNKKPLVISDPHSDSRFIGVPWSADIKSVLCVPLLLKSELIGTLTVFNKRSDEQFTEEDQRLLVILAAQSAQVIENARLHEKELEFLCVQKELQLAADIQKSLLPHSDIEISGYELKGVSLPAQQVGGDYYDFIQLPDERMGICIGDVSGKGLSAALLMSNLQATIRGQAFTNPSPADCLNKSNELLYHCTSSNKFVTLVYGLLDIRAHQFCYANAGHNRPVVLRADDVLHHLDVADLALSLRPNASFREECINLNRGDILFFFSDGASEAMNQKREEFGEERLFQILQTHRKEPVDQIITAVLKAISSHLSGASQNDDITLVALKRY